MKKIIAILSLTLLLTSCNLKTESDLEAVITQDSEPILTCLDKAQASQDKLMTQNENPDINLEFLGEVEVNNTCFLKVKIIQATGENTTEIFTLFNTQTEQSYANYTDEAQMELAIFELKGL